MTIFRWIIGIITALLAGSSVLTFALFMLRDENYWLETARSLRRWTSTVALFWFNVEIWGRVIYTIVTWKR
jgi:hypothetical protein